LPTSTVPSLLRRYARRTTAEVVGELTDNRELRAILISQWGNYGLPPGQSSFAINAIVAHSYLEGAAYPVGGAASIATAIAPTIERAGGAIVVAAEVAEILTEHGRSDRRRPRGARADLISDAGATATFGGLFPPAKAAEFHLLDGLRGLESSMGHLCLYVGMDGPASGGDVVASNLWCHPSLDFDANVARAIDDPNAPLPLLFISFPSAKDPTFAARHPGARNGRDPRPRAVRMVRALGECALEEPRRHVRCFQDAVDVAASRRVRRPHARGEPPRYVRRAIDTALDSAFRRQPFLKP
jgi:all-trans-retinol 13,14-reductase